MATEAEKDLEIALSRALEALGYTPDEADDQASYLDPDQLINEIKIVVRERVELADRLDQVKAAARKVLKSLDDTKHTRTCDSEAGQVLRQLRSLIGM